MLLVIYSCYEDNVIICLLTQAWNLESWVSGFDHWKWWHHYWKKQKTQKPPVGRLPTDVWGKLISKNILSDSTSPACSSFPFQQVSLRGNSTISPLFQIIQWIPFHWEYNPTLSVSLHGHACFDQFVSLHFLQALAHYGGAQRLIPPQIIKALSSLRNCARVLTHATQTIFVICFLLTPVHNLSFCLIDPASWSLSVYFKLSCFSYCLRPLLFSVNVYNWE